MIARWTRMLTDEWFVTTNEGQRVFFRFGGNFGLVAKVLLDHRTEQRLVYYLLLRQIASITFVIASLTAAKLLNLGSAGFVLILITIALVDYLRDLFAMRVLTRNCTALPFDLGIRLYAASKDPSLLRMRCIAFAIVAMQFTVFAAFSFPNWGLVLLLGMGSIWGIASAIFHGYAIFVRKREETAESSDSGRI